MPLDEPQDAMYAFGPFLLMPAQRALLNNGQPVRIGSRAFDILSVLVEHAGQIVGKEELLARAWPRTVIDEGGLRVHVAALRKTLGETPSGSRYISNVPTRGYCFVAPVTRSNGAWSGGGQHEAGRQLPALMTRLVGRDDAILALVRAMPQRRFATLVGPGGLGKTTVALAAAAELEAHYADGAFFVDLSSLSDPAQLAASVATVLGISHGAGGALGALLEWLTTRSVLLVLDNCEHVVDAAAALAESLLVHGGSCHLLTTSREPLRARSEWLVRLPPLAAPPADTPMPWSQAMQYPAFELFVDRASACAEGVALGEADVPQIARICRRLDGIPLAIELVAAQIGFYGLHGLAAMLDGRLSLTALGHRTVQPRHQTLRGTLDWSYGLLPPIEQRVLARLSVFRERFTLPGAMAIAGERPAEASHALVNLVNKSLVATEPAEDGDGSVSYRLLETTRGYAAEKLGVDEAREVAHRHAVHCLGLLQIATLERAGSDPVRWRERQLRKLDDVRAALAWTLREGGDAELGARLVANAAVLFSGLRRMQEYMEWLERAQQALPAGAAEGELHMQLFLEYGQACMVLRGGSAEGLAALQRGAAIARQRGASECELTALRAECSGRLLHGDYGGAQEAAQRYGEVASAARDARAMLSSHRMLGLCLHLRGKHEQALEHVRQALHPGGISLRQAHGNVSQPDERSAALTHLARILWVSGEGERARIAARDAVDSAQALDNPISLLYALTFAACPVAIWDGDLDAAARHVEQLAQCAETHVLGFWQTWPRLYKHALDRLHGHASGAPGIPLESGARLHASQVDMLATFHPSLVGDDARDRTSAQRNPWCSPEVLRCWAERAQAAGEGARALALARQGLALAQQQGARAWQLRGALALARLSDTAQARQGLADALAQVPGHGGSADVRSAQGLLQRFAISSADAA